MTKNSTRVVPLQWDCSQVTITRHDFFVCTKIIPLFECNEDLRFIPKSKVIKY